MHYKDQQIAVAGVSADPNKYGYKIFRDLLKNGYQVIGVNPKALVIEGQQTVATLSQLKPNIDLLIIVTPPEVSLQLIKQAADLKIDQVWLQPGAQSDEVIARAQKLGVNLTHNACFMVNQKLW